ncbi:MAG: ABC transporter ATP-binding protein [Eubacterium sp.]|nr:ABC transporter ATP-binding protein [Candidatus Colimonas fimequi]
MLKRDARNAEVISWFLAVIDKTKLNIVVLMVVQVLLGMSGVALAWFMREMIDQAVAKELDGFIHAAIVFVLIIVATISLRAFLRYMLELTRSTIENKFKAKVFGAALDGDYLKVSSVHSGEWMNRLTSDTVVVADGIATIVPEAAGMVAKIVGAVVLLVIMLPFFAALIVPGGVILLTFSYLFRRKLKELHKGVQEADGSLRIFMTEHLSNLLIVHSFGKTQLANSQAQDLMEGHKAKRMIRNKFSNICNIGFAALINGTYALGAIVCGYGILLGTISYGTFVAVIQLISQIQAPIANVTGYLPKYFAAIASGERLMDAVNGVTRDEQGEDTERQGFSGVEMENVSFSFDGLTNVLEDVNLTINPGDFIAISGVSGGGKSTLLRLLMGVYNPSSGHRICSGQKVFAYVPQGNQLMSGTIRQVLTFGDKELMENEDSLWSALSVACIDDVVRELDGGLDATIGEKGLGLSEGQIQRIAIARALVSNHPVLLLDEATASLDMDTERKLLNNLRELTDRTVVIVTHRPAAFDVCQRRYVVENGRVNQWTD